MKIEVFISFTWSGKNQKLTNIENSEDFDKSMIAAACESREGTDFSFTCAVAFYFDFFQTFFNA